eukprot:TRINITY_DN7309_c0_g1_i1.p1 TRINITY_DN7309_c0_g1~~TRINITY_DN7309_c0_g1_i1.p1  ORF type:complete len:494 (+),score=104.21 TRINITY_DN7309_c0_g1_i1:61-1542(+)
MATLQHVPSKRGGDHLAQLVFRPGSLIVVSPFRRVMIPDAPLPEFFLELIAPHQDRIAVEDCVTGHTVTYEQLSHGIQQAASGLYHLGVRSGDVVALCTPLVPEVPVLFHAALLLGASCTFLPTSLPPMHERPSDAHRSHLLGLWNHILVDSNARFVFTLPSWLPLILPLCRKINQAHPQNSQFHIRHVICISQSVPKSSSSQHSTQNQSTHSDGTHTQSQSQSYTRNTHPALRPPPSAVHGTTVEPSVLSMTDVFSQPAYFPDRPAAPRKDIAALFYDASFDSKNARIEPTNPPAAEFTHAALLAMLVQSLAAEDVHPADRVLTLGSLHQPGVVAVQMMLPLARGARLLTISDPDSLFRPSRIASIIQSNAATRLYLHPPMDLHLLEHQDQQTQSDEQSPFPQLRVVSAVGVPFSSQTIDQMQKKWKVYVRQNFGTTFTILTHGNLAGSETDSLAHIPPPIGSIGQLLPNVECRIINPSTRQPCFIDQPGGS